MVRVGVILEKVLRDRYEKEGIEGFFGSYEKIVINGGDGVI